MPRPAPQMKGLHQATACQCRDEEGKCAAGLGAPIPYLTEGNQTDCCESWGHHRRTPALTAASTPAARGRGRDRRAVCVPGGGQLWGEGEEVEHTKYIMHDFQTPLRKVELGSEQQC